VCQDSRFKDAHIFVINFFKIWVIEILYNAIMHNMEFGQAHCKDFLKRNPKKFILYVYEIYLFILNFRNSNLNEFDLTKILGKTMGTVHLGQNWQWASFTNLIFYAYFQSI
jgi:hypothetical protein